MLREFADVMGSGPVPETMGKRLGLLEFLLSDLNRTGGGIMIQDSTGTVRENRIRYFQRDTRDTVVTDFDNYDCTGTEDDFLEDTVQIDNEIGSKEMRLSRERMRQICVDQSAAGSFFFRYLMKSMNAVRDELDRQVMTEVGNDCVGINVNNLVSDVASAAAKGITVLETNGENRQDGMNELQIDWSENQMPGRGFLIGQGNLERFFMNLNVGCCNDGGIDFSRVASGMNFGALVDQNANELLGDNNVLAIAPGVIQLLTGHENVGAGNVAWNENYAHLQIPDNRIPGLIYDWDIIYTPCDKVYDMRLKLYWEKWCWPTDVFGATDDLSGVTGVFEYTLNRAS